MKPEADQDGSDIRDKWIGKFLAHLMTERGEVWVDHGEEKGFGHYTS